jgi:hypothetical protein
MIVAGFRCEDADMRAVNRFGRLCAIGGVAAMVALSPAASAQPTDEADDKPGGVTVEALLKSGWQVAGYASASNNRSFILFRHPNESHLVQCLAGYDVTRRPPVYSHCYELR